MNRGCSIKRFMKHSSDDPGSSGSLQDLSFLLIIFFIVIAGFNVNKGFLMNMPEKAKPRIVQSNDLIKCVLNADGSILLDGKAVDTARFEKIVSEKKQAQPNMTFFLLIAPDAPYQNVINLIHEVRRLHVENFSFKMEK